MKLGLCPQVLYHLPLDDGLRTAASWGLQTLELPVHRANPWVDVDALLADPAAPDALRRQLDDAGLALSALSIHQESQLLLGPHGPDTAHVRDGPPEARAAFAAHRIRNAATLAHRLGVQVLVGFTGCPGWHRTFPWPDPDGWARGNALMRERLLPILDDLGDLGVTFAHECHPIQQMYDLDSARAGLQALDHHDALGFNLDPANLALADIDPVVFIEALGPRIVHVHGKDLERLHHHQGSGLLAHGAWDRPDRGVRFRVPGWGDLSWRRLITALHTVGYQGTIAVEHEDATMSRREGIIQAVRHLQPLLLHEPPEPRWW